MIYNASTAGRHDPTISFAMGGELWSSTLQPLRKRRFDTWNPAGFLYMQDNPALKCRICSGAYVILTGDLYNANGPGRPFQRNGTEVEKSFYIICANKGMMGTSNSYSALNRILRKIVVRIVVKIQCKQNTGKAPVHKASALHADSSARRAIFVYTMV